MSYTAEGIVTWRRSDFGPALGGVYSAIARVRWPVFKAYSEAGFPAPA